MGSMASSASTSRSLSGESRRQLNTYRRLYCGWVLYAIFHRLPSPPDPRAGAEEGRGTPSGRATAAVAMVLALAWTPNADAAPSLTRPTRSSTAGVSIPESPGASQISADEAARRAAARSIDALTARANLEAARAEEDRVVATFMPRLEGQAQYRRLSDLTQPSLFGSGALVATEQTTPPLTLDDLAPLPSTAAAFPVIVDQWQFGAQINVPLSKYVFELADAVSAAGGGIDAAALEVDAARVKAAADARVAYYLWLAAVAQRGVFVAQRTEAAERVRVNEQRYATGEVAQTDVLEARSALAATELNVARADTQVAVAHESLRRAVRDPADVRYATVDAANTLPTTPPPMPATIAALYDEALRQRVELRRFELLIEALDAAEGLARARALPLLEAFAQVLAANPNPRFIPNRAEFDTTWEVGVRLRWSPSDLLAGLADGRTASADTEQIRIGLEQLKLGIHGALVAARQSVLEARSSQQSAQRGLAAAEAAYRQRKLAYDEGAASILDILQSESLLVNARLNALRAQIDAQIAGVRLAYATGRNVQSVLEPQTP